MHTVEHGLESGRSGARRPSGRQAAGGAPGIRWNLGGDRGRARGWRDGGRRRSRKERTEPQSTGRVQAWRGGGGRKRGVVMKLRLPVWGAPASSIHSLPLEGF